MGEGRRPGARGAGPDRAAHRGRGQSRRGPAGRQARGPAPAAARRPRDPRLDALPRPVRHAPMGPARRARRAAADRAPAPGSRRRSAPAVHRRHHRHPQGRRADPPEPGRERRPGPGLDPARVGHRDGAGGPAVLPRVRHDPVPDLCDPDRRDARRGAPVRRRPGARRARQTATDVHAGRAPDVRQARGGGHRAGRGPHHDPPVDLRGDVAARSDGAGVGDRDRGTPRSRATG